MIVKRQRILIVEDYRDGAEALALNLQHDGHDVRVALDGPSALEMAAAFKPTVVLLDLELPVMNGFEVARRLRATPTGPNLRIVAVSGDELDADIEKNSETQFDHRILKPVDISALESMLQ